MFPNMHVDRQQTLVFGDGPVVVLSKMYATVQEPPPGANEFPQWPGIEPSLLKGKNFTSMALDIQIVRHGVIARTWHMENWNDPLAQMLHGVEPFLIPNPPYTPGQVITRTPQCIKNFYDKILNGPGDPATGQNATLYVQTFTEDYQSRPNALNGTGPGPTRAGNQQIMLTWSLTMEKVYIKRMRTLFHGDKVIVLSDFRGCMIQPPATIPEYPFFPGIKVSSIVGKCFKTMALDIQTVVGGLISTTWHMENWNDALDQMVNDVPAPDFGFSPDDPDYGA
jgi:hypothetical protein